MTTKSRDLYGTSIKASAEKARDARKKADKLACVAWNQRMLGYKGAQPSPALGDALNGGYGFLEVQRLRHASDGRPDDRAPTEGHASP